MRSLVWLVGLASTLCACTDGPTTTVTAQEVRGVAGGKVGVDLLVTDGTQAAKACSDGSLDVTVKVAKNDSNGQPGAFQDIDSSGVVVQCASGAADVAIVVDNSGSEEGHVDAQKTGADALLDNVLGAGGHASIVRVSTNSSIMQALTDDRTALDTALDGMHASNGWTALWDGIRMANETFGAGVDTQSVLDVGDVHQFCSSGRKHAIVAFTDGAENNSADQQSYNHVTYPGDGIATTLADLTNLTVGHTTTPIYTIGLGDHIDEVSLSSLASETGGTYHALTDVSQVQDAYSDIANYFAASQQVCADLPWTTCGDVTIETDWTWTDGGTTITGSKQAIVNIPCSTFHAPGREATLVMTMTDAEVDPAIAEQLAANAVDWVTPKANPQVLVVLDDGNHGENADDASDVRDMLAKRGYTVSYITERTGGIVWDDVKDFDVVWFSNPGYPFNDARSVDTLMQVLANGGGVVAQGDDITQSMGESFPVSQLTHLAFVDNGVTTPCGQPTDNDVGLNLRVTLGTEDHPLLANLQGQSFLYGNDIDLSTPTNTGEQVLGTATLDDGGCPMDVRPTISAYDPPTTVNSGTTQQ